MLGRGLCTFRSQAERLCLLAHFAVSDKVPPVVHFFGGYLSMSRRHVVLLLPGLILVAAMGLKTAVTSHNSNLIAAAPVMNGPDPAPKPWNGPDPAPKPWNGPDPAPKPW